MGKYLMLWEVDQAKAPIDPKERGTGWSMLMAMVKQDREKGMISSWGSFVGETNGYAVYEGTEVEVMKALQQYIPFVIFDVKPIASEEQVNEMIKAMTG